MFNKTASKQGLIQGEMTCVVTQGPKLSRALCMAECPAGHILKFLIIFSLNLFFCKCSLVETVEQGPEPGARRPLCACHSSAAPFTYGGCHAPAPNSVQATASEVSETPRSTRCMGAADISEHLISIEPELALHVERKQCCFRKREKPKNPILSFLTYVTSLR